ncbi:MAG: SulP family inorganic anion transporter [Alphaproteobacteria bacterium]
MDTLLGNIIRNIVIGLAVSFVAISLGASLGVLSGRGAFAGMIATGIIPIITSIMGGTRIQCSGPTAPMSAISAVLIAYVASSYDGYLADDQFITLTFLMVTCLWH